MNATDDWYEVEELTGHSYRITESVFFNSYLIEGDDRALLIDTGGGFGDLRTMVSRLTDLPVTVLVSHAHWDHIGAVAEFDEVLAHGEEFDTEGRISAGGAGGGYGPREFVADWREAGREFPASVDPESVEIEPHTDPTAVAPGREIDLGGRSLDLYHVPGHSPGQLAALDRDDGVLYGADVIHRQHGLYVHLKGCDAREYADTFESLIALRNSGAFDTLYIAHDRPLSDDALSLLEEHRDGLYAILDDELEYELTDDGVREYEVAGMPVLVSTSAMGV